MTPLHTNLHHPKVTNTNSTAKKTGCCKKKNRVANRTALLHHLSRNASRPFSSAIRNPPGAASEQPLLFYFHNPPPPIQGETIRIVNQINESQVEHIARKPNPHERYRYRYLCPICFKYFTGIYSFECCENYICHLCTKDLMKKYREMNLAKPVCIFCRAESPVLQTVDPNLKSRKYEDHGFSSEISGSDVLGDKKRGFRVDLHNEYMFNSSVIRKKGPKKSMTNLDTSKVVLEGKFPSLAFSLQSFKRRRHSV